MKENKLMLKIKQYENDAQCGETDIHLFPFDQTFIASNYLDKRIGKITEIYIDKEGLIHYIDNTIYSAPLIITHDALVKQVDHNQITPDETEQIIYPQFYVNKITHEIIKIDSKLKQYYVFAQPGVELYRYFDELIDVKKNIDWELLPYNKERKLYHTQPVIFGNINESFTSIGFYDINEDSILQIDKNFYNIFPDEIVELKLEQLMTLPFLWDMYIELKR